MIKSVQQYGIDALRLLGHFQRPGASPAPESITELTAFFNQLLDSWNTARNALYSVSDVTYNLQSGQYIYTIGPGGDFNGQRPQRIQRMDLIYQTSPQILRLPIEILDADQWATIRVPNLPNAVPYQAYYDNGFSQTNPTGLGTIYFWPGPMSGFGVEMWIWNTLPTTLASGDTLYAPPGYAKALTYCLADDVMPLYPKRATPEILDNIKKTAQEARAWVFSLNSPSPQTAMPAAIMGRRNRSSFNWLASTS